MENNVFEQMAKKYDTEERIELAKVIVKEVRQELRKSTSKSLTAWGRSLLPQNLRFRWEMNACPLFFYP
ncbi:hypothetical protein K0H71_01020 [Bacillus sp. IITD106]|nr:hypothetical protein [Bacillus sp. IITD106]